MLTRICKLSLLLIALDAYGESHIATSKQQGVLTLQEVMNMAYKYSFSRTNAVYEKEITESQLSQEKSKFGPQLNLEGSQYWIDSDVNKLAGKTMATGQRYPDQISSLTLRLEQPLSGLLISSYKVEAQTDYLRSKDAALEAEGDIAKLRAAAAYVHLLKQLRLVDIKKENLELISKQKHDAETLNKQGKIAALELSRFIFAETEAKSQLSEQKSNLNIAEVQLQELIGIDTDFVVLDISDSELAEPKTRPEHPNLTMIHAQIEGLEAELKARKVDYLPQISAFASYSRDFAAEDIHADFFGLADINIPKEDFQDNLSYGLALHWSLWDWGTRKSRDQEWIARIEQVKTKEKDVSSQIRLGVSVAQSELSQAKEKLIFAKAAEALSKDILRAYELRFKNGLATTTDILSVQQDRSRSLSQLANARYDVLLASLRLKNALGAIL